MKKTVMGLLLIASVFIFSCTPAAEQCSVDDDCVPAQCCHPTGAANKGTAPDCRGVLCTAVCEPGTIDCGQGEIKCVSGKCTAVMNQ